MIKVGRTPLFQIHYRYLCLWFSLPAFVLGGCATDQIYQASTLPLALQASPVFNPRELHLEKLTVPLANAREIASGDVLEMTVVPGLGSGNSQTYPIRVAENGAVQFPGMEPIQLAKLEYEEAEASIRTAFMQSDIYVAPQITLTMKRQFKPRVSVYGAVKRQGPVDLPANSADLATAIVMAGGLRNDAGVLVEIRQPNSTVPILIDLMSAMQSVDRDQFRLQDGASVSIETRDPLPIQVIGLVKKSGRYKFPPGEQLRVLDAIALAGGTSNALADKILVIRRPPQRDPYVIEVSLRKAKLNATEDIALSPGDTVSIEQTAATVLMDVIQTVRFGIGASVRTIF